MAKAIDIDAMIEWLDAHPTYINSAPIAILLRAAKERIGRLEFDLVDQWLSNHAEHCGHQVPPWPHRGICHWGLPPAVAGIDRDRFRQLLAAALNAIHKGEGE